MKYLRIEVPTKKRRNTKREMFSCLINHNSSPQISQLPSSRAIYSYRKRGKIEGNMEDQTKKPSKRDQQKSRGDEQT